MKIRKKDYQNYAAMINRKLDREKALTNWDDIDARIAWYDKRLAADMRLMQLKKMTSKIF